MEAGLRSLMGGVWEGHYLANLEEEVHFPTGTEPIVRLDPIHLGTQEGVDRQAVRRLESVREALLHVPLVVLPV
jgi:hypothetical protein